MLLDRRFAYRRMLRLRTRSGQPSPHTVAMKPQHHIRTLFALGLLAAGVSSASAQPSAAQQRYEQQVARCNDGTLPAPAREACIRAAGNILDNANGGPPNEAAVPSQDGRATVVAPQGTVPSSGGAGTVPSRDGRALIVPSAETAPAR